MNFLNLPLFRRASKCVLLALCVFATSQARAAVLTFGSDTTWDVYNANPASAGAQLLGKAEFVADNATSPAVQPAGVIRYGYPAAGGLTANLSSIPGANWVWAPGITGTSVAPDFQQYFFSKTFSVTSPTLASISVAADDLVEVFVNGTSVGSYGSVVTPLLATQSTLKTFNLLPFLVTGNNTLTIRGENGPSSFSAFATPGQPATYAQNPAAVVFGGSITAAAVSVAPPAPAVPLPAGAWAGMILVGCLLAIRAIHRRRDSVRVAG